MNMKEFIRFRQHVMHEFLTDVKLPVKNKEVHLLKLIKVIPNHPFTFYANHIGLEKGYLLKVNDELVIKEYFNGNGEVE
jgi:hypothetical protein